MTASPLPETLRACAAGIYTHEAGVSLLIANHTFLSHDDFTSRFITRNPTAATAAVDWAAAIAALIADGIPVGLSDTLTGLHLRHASLVVRAIAHATGHANLKPDKK